jgi:FkbM family methyltransferase
MSLVYDVGMCNGDDTAYHLKKGVGVVGIEANPHLIPQLTERFSAEIEQKRLEIENVAVAEVKREVELFIAGGDKPQGSLTRRVLDLHNMPVTSTRVQGVTLSSLVQRHSARTFMKIDVETSDLNVLRDLAAHTIKPRISRTRRSTSPSSTARWSRLALRTRAYGASTASASLLRSPFTQAAHSGTTSMSRGASCYRLCNRLSIISANYPRAIIQMRTFSPLRRSMSAPLRCRTNFTKSWLKPVWLNRARTITS